MNVKSKPRLNKWVLLLLCVAGPLIYFVPWVILYCLVGKGPVDLLSDPLLLIPVVFYPITVVGLSFAFYRYIRQLEINGDKMYVNFWFFPKWGYTLNLRDFDSYLKDKYEIGSRGNVSVYERIFLRKGNQLWLYAEEHVCRNYKEQKTVLQNEMKLNGTFETVSMSLKENYNVWRGRPIDIS